MSCDPALTRVFRCAFVLRTRGILGMVVLLAACAGPAPRPMGTGDDGAALAAQARREAMLARVPEWQLVGRIAVSQGREGGSGRLAWHQQGDHSDISVRAPVTRQGWRLLVGSDGARIDGLDGGPRQDPDAEALLAREVGWGVPLARLRAWVRGARGAGDAEVVFGADGLPALIVQDGWRIEYRQWQSGEPALPLRIFASRGEQRIRLQVDQWRDGNPP